MIQASLHLLVQQNHHPNTFHLEMVKYRWGMMKKHFELRDDIAVFFSNSKSLIGIILVQFETNFSLSIYRMNKYQLIARATLIIIYCIETLNKLNKRNYESNYNKI